jgi:hypothetical protein
MDLVSENNAPNDQVDWDQVMAAHPTWDDVMATHPTWDHLIVAHSGPNPECPAQQVTPTEEES